MDQDKVIQDLKRRFSAPLPEDYNRRIIFWKDEDQEFEETVKCIHIDNVKLVILNGKNNFTVKRLLTEEDPDSNYLVYCPFTCTDENNWLLPIELYSEEFRADQMSMWLDEMGIAATPEMRSTVKGYREFLKNGSNRKKISAMAGKIRKPDHFHLAVMAVLCGLQVPDLDIILRTVLTADLDQEKNSIYNNFVKFGAEDQFWEKIELSTGYKMTAEGLDQKGNLKRLACHLLLTASTRTLRSENLTGLEKYISTPHQAYCYDVVSGWMQSRENGMLKTLAQEVEEELHLPQRFRELSIADLQDTEIFPCIDECILLELMTDIGNQIIQVDVISDVVERRRTCVWYKDYQCYYQGLAACGKMQKFHLDHASGFHTVEPRKIWREYTEDYYQMDTYYREFHCSFSKSQKNFSPLLDDPFKGVADVVEGLYSNWFLEELGSSWSNACAEELERYGRIQNIPQQEEFYHDRVGRVERKVYVIISDAFRYEVAASLAERLRRETQAEVRLDSCEAIFPTVTKFGMAALLPHKELSVEYRSSILSVLADGRSTEAPYREDVLKKANPSSVAVKYRDLVMEMKAEERSKLVKGKEVVYIYHNKIDEMSHSDENEVFTSCDEAIQEIQKLIRIIVNEFGGTNIFITADHGFLYTYRPLEERDKADKGIRDKDVVELDRRYLITRKGSPKPEHLLPVKFLDGETEYEAYAPRESIRIRKKGSGENFVHGGISLQEMVVPVVEYHYLRNQSKEYRKNRSKYDVKPVAVSLLSTSRKISNMIFSLNFYQNEPVGSNRKAATYQLNFVDSENRQVSDTAKIIADKTSENNQDRTFRVNFNLKSQKFDSREPYYLVIADESGLQAPERTEFTIDIAFAMDDFDFFS